jgi:hypothetical protein
VFIKLSLQVFLCVLSAAERSKRNFEFFSASGANRDGGRHTQPLRDPENRLSHLVSLKTVSNERQ